MTTGKTIALTRRTFVGKIMSLLFNMLSRLVIAFLPRSKGLLISWLQSPSAVIWSPPQNKVWHCFHQTLGENKQNLVHTRTQEKGALTPQETEPDLPVSVQKSWTEVLVNSGLCRSRAMNTTVLGARGKSLRVTLTPKNSEEDFGLDVCCDNFGV